MLPVVNPFGEKEANHTAGHVLSERTRTRGTPSKVNDHDGNRGEK